MWIQFLKTIAEFNIGLLTDSNFLQQDVLLTDNPFLCTIRNKPKLLRSSCTFLSNKFEIEAEKINLNRYCIRKADSESLRLFFLNNRLHCSNDANRMLEMFYGLYYQAVDKYIPKKTICRSKDRHWMSSHSIKAEKCLQTALKHNCSDEKVKRCKHNLNDSLELDKAVYFESMKDFDLKMTYTFLRSINGKAKVPRKTSYKNTS